jgi:hypothetical protein
MPLSNFQCCSQGQNLKAKAWTIKAKAKAGTLKAKAKAKAWTLKAKAGPSRPRPKTQTFA